VASRFRDDQVVDGPPRPHPEVGAFLARTAPPLNPWAGVADVRADVRERVLAVTGPLAPVAAVDPVDADGVPARLYRPGHESDGVLVWAHGGGWTYGDLDTCEGVARALANRSGCAVLAIDYRLAPEHPFPAALDDTWAALGWARRHFDQVGVGGDSSGGNLAAAVALKARDERVPLTVQLLVYPVLDSRPDTPFKLAYTERYARFAGQPGYGLNTYQRLQHVWADYVPDPALRTAPYASPTHAGSVAGVAPAVVITAEHDFLRGEAEEYAARLQTAAVPVELHEFAGQIHGFFEMFAVLTDAHRAVRAAAVALQRAFRTVQLEKEI